MNKELISDESMKEFFEQNKQFLQTVREWLVSKRDAFDVKAISHFTMIIRKWLTEVNDQFKKDAGMDPDTKWQ